MLNEVAALKLNYLIELLKDGKDVTKEFQKLNDFLVTKNCTFSGKVMPTFVKPNFITSKQTSTLQQIVSVISSVLNKFIRLYLTDKNVQKIMNFSEEEKQLFSIDPGFSTPLVIARLDAFMSGCDIKFLEFNCDSPAGIAYADVLEEGFMNFLAKYSLFDYWQIKVFNRQEQLLQTLLHCYHEFNKGESFHKNPTIAIVDWDHVSTSSEFQLLKTYFEAKGYHTIITTPQKLKIKNGVLTSDEEPVHIVYRRVITRELIERLDESRDFIQAVREKLVCMANPFRSFIVGNKKVLALITDPNFQYIFTRGEREVIRDCIPWTQILKNSKVLFNNFTINLRTFISDNKDKLVLKPASSYGGKNVHIGRETSDEKWESIINENIHTEEWVVQEYVPIPEDIFPETMDNGVNMKLKKVNINPFALLNKYSGTITRISDSSVINVSAGGGLIPTMTVVKK